MELFLAQAARHGFVAKGLIDSMVSKKILSPKDL